MKIEKKVLILLGNGFELIETSCFTDVFAWASFNDNVNINTTCVSVEPIVKSAFGGIVLENLQTTDTVDFDEFDALAIPGGMEWAGFFDSMYSEKFVQVLQHFSAHRKPIAAVCVASLALANAGVLKGRRASIYHSETGKHAEKLQSFGAIFEDSPVTIDAEIITSSGPGTAVEVANSLLHIMTSQEIANTTRKMMRVPQPNTSWYTPQVP